MNPLTYGLNTLWMLRCQPEWSRFVQASKDPEETQSRVLRSILKTNRETEFGRQYDFASIDLPATYRHRLPMISDETFRLQIERMAAGEPNVLTSEPVLLFQPTSGSSGPEKWIPYTRSLQREYQRMVGAWIGNLFRAMPGVRRGPAYWSISPAHDGTRRTSGGIPIGFDDDTAYLGRLERIVAKQVLALPTSLARETDIDRFRYRTLLGLLQCEDLAMISIWSPTFLTAIFVLLDTHREMLIEDLARGNVWDPHWKWGSDISEAIDRHPKERTRGNVVKGIIARGNRARAQQVQKILSDSDDIGMRCRKLWPQLALISCWLDGSSRFFSEKLRGLCREISFQGKGLLATEAAISFPVVGEEGSLLALRSHFLEFLPTGSSSSGDPLLAHQLKKGDCYDVVVTTGGGLYRYPMHDTVEVIGFWNRCPRIRFLGRSNRTSDFVGEKVSEVVAHKAIETVLHTLGIHATQAFFIPIANDSTSSLPYYRLELEVSGDSLLPSLISEALEGELRMNPHYACARDLGQLGPVQSSYRSAVGGQRETGESTKSNLNAPLGAMKPQVLKGRSCKGDRTQT